MRAVLVLAVVSLLGCGGSGPDFAGTYYGMLTTSGSCSDGSLISPQTVRATWVISDSGSSIDINDNGSCSPLAATVAGGVATVISKTCPALVNSGGTAHPSITGGRLELTGSSMGVHLNESSSVTLTGGATGTCTSAASGTLTK